MVIAEGQNKKVLINASSWDSVEYCKSDHVERYIESLEKQFSDACAGIMKAYQLFKAEPYNSLRLERLNAATIKVRSIYKYAELWLDEFGRIDNDQMHALQESQIKEHYKNYGSCRDEGFRGKEYIKE